MQSSDFTRSASSSGQTQEYREIVDEQRDVRKRQRVTDTVHDVATTTLPHTLAASSSAASSTSLLSLYCDEELDFDDWSPPEPAAAGKENVHDIRIAHPPTTRPPITESLIFNYLAQVSTLHDRQWKAINVQELPIFMSTTVQEVLTALHNKKDPHASHESFVAGLSMTVKLCGDEEKHQKLKRFFLQVVSSLYTSINALKIHREALYHYAPKHAVPDVDTAQSLLFAMPVLAVPPIVQELADLWAITLQSTKGMEGYLAPNLPNRIFEITIPSIDHPITFFRMQSPEHPLGVIDPLFERFLESHESNDTSHLSLILLSPNIFDSEAEIARQRFQLQMKYPSGLNAWRCEPDSDFVAQDCEFSKKEPFKNFETTLRQHLLKESPSFEVLEEIRDSKRFAEQVDRAISFVKELFFPHREILDEEEKQDFILMCVVLIHEGLCEELDPSTVDMACRSHIDRGMMISTILYLYLMIKSGKTNDPIFLDYLKELTLAPALVVAQRPPHMDKMQRVLSLACRLLDPAVIKMIQSDQTFFSGCQLSIPEE